MDVFSHYQAFSNKYAIQPFAVAGRQKAVAEKMHRSTE
jgi:hypothetical protein